MKNQDNHEAHCYGNFVVKLLINDKDQPQYCNSYFRIITDRGAVSVCVCVCVDGAATHVIRLYGELFSRPHTSSCFGVYLYQITHIIKKQKRGERQMKLAFF